jgi:serine/threonine protein kinase
MKAKVIAGIVLGLRFAHSLGLVHGRLTSSNIFFDSNNCTEIVDFQSMLLEVGEMEGKEETQLGGFWMQRWSPERDLHGFALIRFEMIVGRPAQRTLFHIYNKIFIQ